MRLIDADALIDRSYRERLDSRELIAQMIESAPTVAMEDDFVALKKRTRLLVRISQSLRGHDFETVHHAYKGDK